MKILVLCSAILAASTANAGFFNELNKALEVTNGILGAATGKPTTNSSSSNTYASGQPNPTDAQLAQIETKLKSAASSGNSARALQAASPMLKDFLATVACSDEYGMRNIGRYTTLNAASVGKRYHFSGAMSGLKYHPKKTQCMTVTQIGNLSMPALNALKLKVMFVSDTSGETSAKTYLLMKQEDGTWLVDDGLLYE